jgi:dienelactone hydrolase
MHGLIETIPAIAAAAKERQAPFTLVVYPEADHGFNLSVSPKYRSDYDLDAWQQTLEMLHRYQPVP